MRRGLPARRRRPAAGLVPACALALGLLAGCAHRGSVREVRFVPPPPTPAPTPEPAAAPLRYRVRPGDSLWRLAWLYLGQGRLYPRIAKENGIKDPSLIRAGRSIRISGARAFPSHWARRGRRRAEPKPESFRVEPRPNAAFAVGEKLTFAVQYFNLTAGFATLSVPGYSFQSGRLCYDIVAKARSHPFFDHVFKVRDQIDSFIDTQGLFSWRYEKHLHEGGFKADSSFVYDQRHHLLINDRQQCLTIPAATQDVLSCFYYYRTLSLKPGDVTWIHVAADDMKNYDLEVKVLRREKVSVLAGDFNCIVVEPFLKFNGVFQQKGRVLIWLTDDQRHLPVLIESKIVIGSINIVLEDAQWAPPRTPGRPPRRKGR